MTDVTKVPCSADSHLFVLGGERCSFCNMDRHTELSLARTLAEDYQQALEDKILMNHEVGMTYKEISEHVHYTVSWVYKLAQRARVRRDGVDLHPDR